MGAYLAPKPFAERFDYVAGIFPRLAERKDSGPARCPAASGRWSPWAVR